jgi:hypothetical protein
MLLPVMGDIIYAGCDGRGTTTAVERIDWAVARDRRDGVNRLGAILAAIS